MIVQLFLLSGEIATRQPEEQRDATPASQCIIYFTETYSIIFRCLTCCCSITGKKQVENLPTQVSALWARWQNFKRACLEHWATWRQSLCMSAASLSSLAFRWDFAGKRGGKKCPLLRMQCQCQRGERWNILLCAHPVQKHWLLWRQINILPVCAICRRVTWGLSFPGLTAYSEAWRGWCGVGWLFCFPCSLNAVWLVPCHCNSLLLLLSLRLRSKQMCCHGFTRMCMGMWGVSMVRISGTPQYVNTT